MITGIDSATALDNYILHLKLTNGNELSMNFKNLFCYPRFAVLANSSVWKSMCAHEYSICWQSNNLPIEYSIDTILAYFA